MSVIPPAPIVALVAIAMSGCKLLWAEASSRTILGCEYCVSHKALPHEAQWLLTLWALHLAGQILATRSRWVAAACRMAVLGLMAIAVADLVVLQQFFTRLTLGEVMKFIGEPQAIRGFVGQLPPAAMLAALGAAGAAMVLAGLYVADAGRPKGARRPLALLGVAAAGFVGSALAKVDDFHTPYLNNANEAFFASQSRHRAYSPSFANAVPPRDTATDRCFDGIGAKPDVILLMVESLSMYQSRRFSGIEDWLPAFDRLAGEGMAYPHFHANGIISEQALIALLTGEPPIEKPDAHGRPMFESFMSTRDTVPKLMRREGYTARFISAFNLDFPGLLPWLQAVGFERVEGQEAAFFQGRPATRMHFDAWPDELLFERLLHELALPRAAPLFVTAFTQSTHHPYVDPSSGTRTQEAAFRYLDRSLARFVEGLRAQRFFDNGLLLIVGDHRAMQPMGARERERFGDRGFARVPMAVLGGIAGKPMQGTVNGAFSQTDLLPTLRHLVGRERACLAPDQGIFLPAERALPQCLYTLRPYNPDGVYAHCAQGDAVVRLNGDQTDYAGPPPGPHPVREVVNRLRLGKGY